jgi:Uma2 family endonuclease
MPNDGRKYELVDGQIRVSPAGGRHGLIIVELTGRLLAFVKRARLGYVFESSAGVRMVWVLDPEARSASIYRSLTDVRTLFARSYRRIDGAR